MRFAIERTTANMNKNMNKDRGMDTTITSDRIDTSTGTESLFVRVPRLTPMQAPSVTFLPSYSFYMSLHPEYPGRARVSGCWPEEQMDNDDLRDEKGASSKKTNTALNPLRLLMCIELGVQRL